MSPTTEKFTRTLRELVKRPENKVCADCKRNGQDLALTPTNPTNHPSRSSMGFLEHVGTTTNVPCSTDQYPLLRGVFLCIRCSGIHRGMGTHISKVKSVDLDTWTPEQMDVSLLLSAALPKLISLVQSIQKWGNHLANLYWEAHLKPGHIPPEQCAIIRSLHSDYTEVFQSKMESFIRSKYESRRWALEGTPPNNPSDLESCAQSRAPPPQPEQQQIPESSRPSHTSTASISARTPTVTSQPQAHRLLSSNYTTNPSQTMTAQRNITSAASADTAGPVLAQPKAPEHDLFSLDFHAPASPAPTAQEAPKKDVKQDILSLFSSPSQSSAPVASTFGQFGAVSAAEPWATQTAVPPQQQQATSMIGTSGVGAWGANSGWGAPVAAPPAQGNIWGAAAGPASQPQPALFNTTAVWGASSTSPVPAPAQDPFSLFAASGTTPGAGSGQLKKDDVFGDLWGGFK
ncbi:hypothetical protein H0H87_011969 [Tephrocybe sp. NHM501043]|nr:hypothetical protein H0H87_011969 [Tephrocybe sp. NHM501043]